MPCRSPGLRLLVMLSYLEFRRRCSGGGRGWGRGPGQSRQDHAGDRRGGGTTDQAVEPVVGPAGDQVPGGDGPARELALDLVGNLAGQVFRQKMVVHRVGAKERQRTSRPGRDGETVEEKRLPPVGVEQHVPAGAADGAGDHPVQPDLVARPLLVGVERFLLRSDRPAVAGDGQTREFGFTATSSHHSSCGNERSSTLRSECLGREFSNLR